MNPADAYKAYNDAERAAADEYKKYWFDKFAAAGVAGVIYSYPHPLTGRSSYNGYDLSIYTTPSRYEGVKVAVRKPGITHYYPLKIKSDTGFAKLMLKLDRGLLL